VRVDGSPGPVETAATHVLADDFAFGVSGSLYITTHPEQTVVRLDLSGARATVAGPDQGAVGSTACAFGRAPGDANALYVTTDGGLVAPHLGLVQEAKLLRLEALPAIAAMLILGPVDRNAGAFFLGSLLASFAGMRPSHLSDTVVSHCIVLSRAEKISFSRPACPNE
jgi:hypothetical protein